MKCLGALGFDNFENKNGKKSINLILVKYYSHF